MKVLVIDDEKSIRLSLKIGLEKLGLHVFSAETGEEGLAIVQTENPDAAIVDIKLPGIDGIEVLKQIKQTNPLCLVMMITYLSEVKLAVNAMKIGAYDYFTKPFSLADIQKSLEKTIAYIRTKKELDRAHLAEEAPLVGTSPVIQKIKKIAREIGRIEHDTCVLIQAESGTGKEVVARLIHNVKYQSMESFVAINCAAIPKNLQESELFGYEKGAFSDAKTSKQGLIEKANGGVLFLDEIGDMDPGLQAKMLRVLQEKKFRRIGGLKEIEFKATIVAATNKDLLKEIKAGHFREDLYYRLNIIPITIPPLRQRREDIPLLASYFVEEYNKRLGKKVASISNEALEALIQCPWYGNVRELKNMIERVMIFNSAEEITLEDLPDEVFVGYTVGEGTVYTSLASAEEEIIERALMKHNWNITRTAEELGMSRLTLRKRIQKYGLRDINTSQ